MSDSPIAGTPAPALTQNDVSEAAAKAVAPVAAQVGQLTHALQRILAEREAAPEPEPVRPEGTPSAAERLVADPDAYIEERIKRVLPTLPQGQAADISIRERHEEILSNLKGEFDEEFGDGKFDELILPKVTPTFQQMAQSNPASLASRRFVEAAVRSVEGFQRKDLFKLASERMKQRAENPTELMPRGSGLRGRSGGEDDLSADELRALSELNEGFGSVVSMDRKTYAAYRGHEGPLTYSTWKSKFKGEKAVGA